MGLGIGNSRFPGYCFGAARSDREESISESFGDGGLLRFGYSVFCSELHDRSPRFAPEIPQQHFVRYIRSRTYDLFARGRFEENEKRSGTFYGEVFTSMI